METRREVIGELGPDDLVMIEGEPCVIGYVEKTEAGKHGGTKKSLKDCEGLFDRELHEVSQPIESEIEVPVVEHEDNPVIYVADDGDHHFEPRLVSVSSDATVVWMVDDDGTHLIADDEDQFRSDILEGAGNTFEQTLEYSSQVYRYDCEYHGSTGAILVESE